MKFYKIFCDDPLYKNRYFNIRSDSCELKVIEIRVNVVVIDNKESYDNVEEAKEAISLLKEYGMGKLFLFKGILKSPADFSACQQSICQWSLVLKTYHKSKNVRRKPC